MIVFVVGKNIDIEIEFVPGSSSKYGEEDDYYYCLSVKDPVIKNAFPSEGKIQIFLDHNSARLHRNRFMLGHESGFIKGVAPIFAIRINQEFMEESITVSQNGTDLIRYYVPLKYIREKIYVDFINDIFISRPGKDHFDRRVQKGKIIDLQNKKRSKYRAVLFQPKLKTNSQFVGVTTEVAKKNCQLSTEHHNNNSLMKHLNELIEVYCNGIFRTHKLEAEKLKDKLVSLEKAKEEPLKFKKKIFYLLLDELLSLTSENRFKDYGSMLITAIQYFESGIHYKELINATAKEILDTKMNNNVSNLILSYLDQPQNSRGNSV